MESVEQLHIHVYVHLDPPERLARMEELLNELRQGQQNLMSKVTDFAAQEANDLAAMNTKVDAIITGIGELDTLIKNLEATLPVDTLTPESQAALDALTTARAALVLKVSGIDTTAPVPAPPI